MKVAIVQISVNDSEVEENLNKIKSFVEKIDADLLIFPEYSTSMSIPLRPDDLENVVKASRDKTVIIGSLLKEGGKVFDAAIVIHKSKILSVRRKRYLFKPLGENFEEGELPFSFSLNDFATRIIICYELRFPELFWNAELFIVIGAWPKDRIEHWVTLLRARSIESLAYVIGVNRWGRSDKAFFGGHSCAFDPWGTPLACLGEGEGIAIFTIEREKVKKAREFPAISDRARVRKELFGKETER